jgi:hypothetical protein
MKLALLSIAILVLMPLAAQAAPPPAGNPDLSPKGLVAQPRAGPAAPAPARGEVENLVLELVINGIQMEDFVDGARQDGKLYLPLHELSSLLDFPITIDADKKTAQGWFIRTENTFTLSPDRAQVRGSGFDVPKDGVLSIGGDLYIDSKLLSQWFPLDFAFDEKLMTLGIHSREALPFQEKALREKSHTALEQQKAGAPNAGAPAYKQVELPYAGLQVPFIDLTASPSYDSKSRQASAAYTAIAAGDIGYMTTRVYAAGDPLGSKALSDLRLSAGRQSYDGTLLGPAKATYFLMGDINSASLGQVAATGPGRGFFVTNRKLDRADKFDVTSFVGDSKPGWEVELYRNGTLIDFQTVDINGRYQFIDVPILFGTNVFRLSFYGPQGQTDEITKTINADSSLIEKGQYTYNFSVDQKSRTLFGVADDKSQPSGLRSVGEVEYGVTKYLTVAAGGAHTVLQDGSQHSYGTAGLRASLFGVLGSLDNAYDETDNGHSSSLTLFGNFLSTDLHFQQVYADKFISETTANIDDPVHLQTVLGANRQLNLAFLKDISAGLTLTRTAYESGRQEEQAVSQLSRAFMGINFTNTLTYGHDNLALNNVTGIAALRGFYKKILLGGQLNYDVRPRPELNNLNLTATWLVRPDINSDTALTHDFLGGKDTQLSETVTFDMKKYKFSLTGRAGTDGDLFAGVTVNTGFGPLPGTRNWLFSSQGLTQSGIVIVRPFIDSNYNQKRDPGEEIPTDATFKIGSQMVKMDKDGAAMASNLPTNDIVMVHLDQTQGKDPFLSGSSYEYRVVPREGKPVVIDYPLFEVSQVDGTVHPPPGINAGSLKVDLVSADGQTVGSTHTAFDGYYLLQGIAPGNYKIRVGADDLASRHLRQTAAGDLEVTKADFYIKDITLEKDKSAVPGTAAPAMPAVPVTPVTPTQTGRGVEKKPLPKREETQRVTSSPLMYQPRVESCRVYRRGFESRQRIAGGMPPAKLLRRFSPRIPGASANPESCAA